MKVLTDRPIYQERAVYSSLEVVDIQTGACTQLFEFDHLIEAPNWTQDGRNLVYNDRGYLYFYDIASGVITQLDTGYCVRCNNDHVLSPDGTGIAVSHNTWEDGQSRIYTIPYAGGAPRLITPIAPSYLHGWSPDGGVLAYCAERNGEYDIYAIPAVGGIETQLTFEKGLNDGPEYSPDGQYIWFNSVRSGLMQVWRMRADGSEQTQMTFDDDSNSWFPHISPDGEKVAYISYRKDDVAPADHPANKNVEIRLMNAAGGDYRMLVKLFGGQGTINVNSWSPCSSKLAFVRYRTA